MTSITITFYGLESDKATNDFRNSLKGVSTANYDDCGDYFVLYNVKQYRSTCWETEDRVCHGYIVFDNEDIIYIENYDFDLEW